jgi:N-acetylneuraminate synthase/N,N'-diacetyllegionaminate synthase
MISNDDVYVIAEIGGNHEGNFEKALDLLHQAADAGAHAIKYQIYTGETLVNEVQDPARVKHFDRFALKDEQYEKLATECKSRNVDFCASIWSERSIEKFSHFLPYIKVGSGDLTAYPVLTKLAELNKPIILSTGLSNIEEIKASINHICKANSNYKNQNMLSILQCTSMYPIPNEDANLSVITSFKNEFHYPIGYSDHTSSTYAAEIAVALGASILEVHFTDTKESTSFRDHQVSFNSDDLKKLIKNINVIKKLLGDGIKRPMKSEIENGHLTSFRRAIYPIRNISKNETVTLNDFIALRPENGLPATEINNIIGKKANRDLSELESISISDFS